MAIKEARHGGESRQVAVRFKSEEINVLQKEADKFTEGNLGQMIRNMVFSKIPISANSTHGITIRTELKDNNKFAEFLKFLQESGLVEVKSLSGNLELVGTGGAATIILDLLKPKN